MSRRTQTAVIMLVTSLLLIVALMAAGRPPDRRAFSRPEARIETVEAELAQVSRADPHVSARAVRDAWLFREWVRAVAAQRDAFLRAALELHQQPFLVCVRAHESDTAGGYTASDGGRNGDWNLGAYQFSISTWDATARHAGWNHLDGVRPDRASGFDQDRMAWHLYGWQGPGPWAGSGCY